MVQAARSGVQNIAEGSQVSATSKKMELKLTQVARASLEELLLDYKDYLRQNRLSEWPINHPYRVKLISARLKTADEIAQWVATNTIAYQKEYVKNAKDQTQQELSANAILSIIVVTTKLLDRQVLRLASDFEKNGGFSERLYRFRRK